MRRSHRLFQIVYAPCRPIAQQYRHAFLIIIGARWDRLSRYGLWRFARSPQQQEERQHAEGDKHHQPKIIDIGNHRGLPRHLCIERSEPVRRRKVERCREEGRVR
jgi:hypothetical protein